MTLLVCVLDTLTRDLYGRDLVTHGEHGNIQLFTHNLKLLDRRGTVNVTRDQKRSLALLFIHPRKFSRMRGFTRALQTHHHDDCGRLGGNGQLCLRSAH